MNRFTDDLLEVGMFAAVVGTIIGALAGIVIAIFRVCR